MDKKNMLNMILLAGIGIAMGIAIMVYVYQKKLLRKERLLQRKEEEINQNTIKIQENEMIIVRNRNRMEELTMQIEENKGVQEQLEEQHKALVEIQQQNESLKQENETLQNNIDKYSFTLNEKSNELNRLEILTKENQRLRDRETYLSNLLIKDIRVIKNLKDKKSPINILQWDEIKKNIDLLFDNYTIRLSQVIPSMTESDLQVCCLIKLRFSNLDIADILNISPTSVSKRKFRLKERIIQKLGSLGESHTLDLWLLEF
jgi:DNA-binding CsgD family transcriptional regulator